MHRLEPIQATNSNPERPYTKEINKHIPSGVCVYSKFVYGKVKNSLKLYTGEDCVEVFCNYIYEEARRLYHMFLKKSGKPLTHEQWRKFNGAPTCHIRLNEFEESDPKVRDDCHYTEKYQGPAIGTVI